MMKAICFTAKPNFLSPRCTLLQLYFMQTPVLGAQLRSRAGRTQAAKPHPPLLLVGSARHGDLKAGAEKSFKSRRAV